MENELSVWHVEEDKANLRRVLTALAASRDDFSNIDYLLFDDAVLSGLDVKIRKTNGNTPDNSANLDWHRDLVELSGRKVLGLAEALFQDSEKTRVLENTVSEWINVAVTNGEVNRSKLGPKLAAKVVSLPAQTKPVHSAAPKEVATKGPKRAKDPQDPRLHLSGRLSRLFKGARSAARGLWRQFREG